jgi:hypothetical protein
VIVPVDSGEKSATLTTKQLQDFSVVGRSAAEFIKIMPGFAIANTGTENRSNFSGETIGINGNGDAGSQSALNNAYNVNYHRGRRPRIRPGLQLRHTSESEHRHDPGVQGPDFELLCGEPEGSGGHPECRKSGYA